MSANKIALYCDRCPELIHRDGVPLGNPVASATCFGIAFAALWRTWPGRMNELLGVSSTTDMREAFCAEPLNFPRYLWATSHSVRSRYAAIIHSMTTDRDRREGNLPLAFRSAQEQILVHLKALVYGEELAKEPFDPRRQGDKLHEFTLAGSSALAVLLRMPITDGDAFFCPWCGLVGPRHLFRPNSKPFRGKCRDCSGPKRNENDT